MNTKNTLFKNRLLLQITVVLLVFISTFHGLLTVDRTYATFFIFVCNVLAIFIFWKTHASSSFDFSKLDKTFIVLWFLLGGVILVSETIHLDIVESPFILICIPIFYFWLYPLFLYHKNWIYKVVFTMGIPFVGFVLLMMLKRHKFHTNSIALTILTSAVALIMFQKEFLDQNKFKQFVISDLLSLTALVTIVYVGSRTSILTFLSVYVLNIITNLYSLKKQNSPIKNQVKYYYIVILMAMCLVIMLKPTVFTNLIFKWTSDISSGRNRIWKATLNQFSLFGNGYDFYRLNPHIGVGPHNVLIGLLAFNGPLAMILFLVIILKLIKDILFTKKIQEILITHRNLLLMTTAFLICGFFEGLFNVPIYRPLNLLWFTELGRFYIKSDSIDYEDSPESIRISKMILIVMIVVLFSSLIIIPGDGNVFSILNMIDKYL